MIDVDGWTITIKDNPTQVELRKKFRNWNSILLIVSNGTGYSHKFYKPERTEGVNVHMSLNGPLQLTFAELDEIRDVVQKAKKFLTE